MYIAKSGKIRSLLAFGGIDLFKKSSFQDVEFVLPQLARNQQQTKVQHCSYSDRGDAHSDPRLRPKKAVGGWSHCRGRREINLQSTTPRKTGLRKAGNVKCAAEYSSDLSGTIS